MCASMLRDSQSKSHLFWIEQLKNEEEKTAEINRLKKEIKEADKRTYNGRMTKIFNEAEIEALQE